MTALRWRNGPEMPLVEAEKALGFVALRENLDRAIGRTEAEIGVAGVEFGNRAVVIGFQACDVIAAGGQIAEEGAPGRFAEADTEQVVDLGRNRCRQDQPALLLVMDPQQYLEPRLLGVGQRHKRRRVEDERNSPKSRINSSSGISEIGRESESMRSKLPARAKFRSRRGAGR